MAAALRIDTQSGKGRAMMTALKLSWALFLGLTLIMIGNGLGGSLVGVRTQVEDFGNTLTGLVMAGYFLGFFIGSIIVPRMMARVGHVRVFGALTALASLTILIYPLFIDPYVWTAMRVLTGVSYAGLYIVVESWLNEKATNDTRGQMLAIYLVVSSLGVAGGQLLLNLYDPANFELFTVVSVLISLAAVPVLVSAARAPDFEAPESLGPLRLYKVSPLGTIGMVLVGMTAGILIGMGPAYGFKMYGTEFASLFMTAIFVGGFLFTWPIGKLSDIFDRRTVIVCVVAACVGVGIFGLFFQDPAALNQLQTYQRFYSFDGSGILNDANILLLVALVFGGMALPLYSLCIAHTNDHLTTKQMVAASSTLIMANGLGAMVGPSIAGLAMDMVGTPGYFWALIAVNVIFVIFGLYRMSRRPAIAAEEQGSFVAVDSRMTVVATTALNPEVEWPETEQDADLIDGDAPPPDAVHPEGIPEVDASETWDDLPEVTPDDTGASTEEATVSEATTDPDSDDGKGRDRSGGA